MKLKERVVKKRMSYAEKLERHLISISSSARNFGEIVQMSKGAYPLDVLNALNELRERGLVGTIEMNTVEQNLSKRNRAVLSDPHPADYDWRFHQNSIELLVKLTEEFIANSETVALFGATTIFPPLKERGRSTLLFNKSESLIENLKNAGYNDGLFCQDLFCPFDQSFQSVNLVIADPPWYPDYYEAFILRASELLDMHGFMFLSVLPELTRPDADKDRKKIQSFAEKCGFELYGVKPDLLKYESPHFEVQALKAKDISCGVWRTGDLFIFRKINIGVDGIEVSKPDDEPEWMEFVFGCKKVKIKKREVDLLRHFTFTYIDDTPTLSSVSRRAPQRKLIDFWSSDNIAYSISRPDILIDALSLYKSGHIISQIVETIKDRYRMNVSECKELEVLLTQIN